MLLGYRNHFSGRAIHVHRGFVTSQQFNQPTFLSKNVKEAYEMIMSMSVRLGSCWIKIKDILKDIILVQDWRKT
jgi:hypothetical protein